MSEARLLDAAALKAAPPHRFVAFACCRLCAWHVSRPSQDDAEAAAAVHRAAHEVRGE